VKHLACLDVELLNLVCAKYLEQHSASKALTLSLNYVGTYLPFRARTLAHTAAHREHSNNLTYYFHWMFYLLFSNSGTKV
jgi:hypothetical protein